MAGRTLGLGIAKSVEYSFGRSAPGKLSCAAGTGGGEPAADFIIRDQPVHHFCNCEMVARVEFEGCVAREAIHGFDL
jgi:hypothetical protein